VARGSVSAEDATAITRAMQQILDDFDFTATVPHAERQVTGAAEAAVAPPLRVLGCAARDDVDDVALRLLAGRLSVDGVDVQTVGAALLSAEVVDRVAAAEPGVVVVAMLAPGGLAQARYVVKRVRARLPELPVVAVRWGPPDGQAEARAQLLAAGATEFTTTLREARERVLQYRQVRTEPAPSAAA
jgi:CheY-like chemotaxis protein